VGNHGKQCQTQHQIQKDALEVSYLGWTVSVYFDNDTFSHFGMPEYAQSVNYHVDCNMFRDHNSTTFLSCYKQTKNNVATVNCGRLQKDDTPGNYVTLSFYDKNNYDMIYHC